MTQAIRITGRAVADFVGRHYGVTFDELAGPRRTLPLARARQFAMYAMRELCPHMSYPAIGRLLGGRDHTTILHGCRKVERLIREGDFADELHRLSLWFDEAYVDEQVAAATARLDGLQAMKSQIQRWPA
jgi:chromosomal replication initiation ATPase DnaA